MKKMILLLTALAVLSLTGFAESYRKTTADMYIESYMATMRRQTGASTAELRAEGYRSLYEVCDEHHNCTNVTAGTAERQVAEVRSQKDQTETVKPFAHVPVWM